MRSAEELDAELARMRRSMRRLVAIMTVVLMVGVGAIAAVVGLTLSSADRDAARSFDAGWRKDGKDTRVSQVRPAPKATPSRSETTGAANAIPPSPPNTAAAPAVNAAPATENAGLDDPLKRPDEAAPPTRKKHSRRYLARSRVRSLEEERARSDEMRRLPDGMDPSRARSDRMSVVGRPGSEQRPKADGPPDYGGGREAPRSGPFGLFGGLFGSHPD